MNKRELIIKLQEDIKDMYDLITISSLNFKDKNILYKKLSRLDHDYRELVNRILGGLL